jgi:hypothetical protein
MASQLRVRWDGDVPGIAERRLSLNAFGQSLEALLVALRRIATQMVGNAVGAESPKAGRFANLARQLDIEITDLEHNSTGFDSIVTFSQPPDELPLFADLPGRAVLELLDSIERESKGQPANYSVRKFLSTLPSGVHRQVYELHDNGTTRKRIELGEIKILELPQDLPILREIEGNIVGVGFEPGRSEVRVKTEGMTTSLSAQPDVVDRALSIRHDRVRAMSIHVGGRARLISLELASKKRMEFTPEIVEEHLFGRWNDVLARLAQ